MRSTITLVHKIGEFAFVSLWHRILFGAIVLEALLSVPVNAREKIVTTNPVTGNAAAIKEGSVTRSTALDAHGKFLSSALLKITL